MLQVTDIVLINYFKWRQKQIEKVFNHPMQFQNKILKRILKENATTIYGQKHNFNKLNSYEAFAQNVPVVNYEDIFPYIKQGLEGEKNILTHNNTNWYAKSSGTSNDRSKYIPVTPSYLKRGHLKCAWDAASFIYNEDPSAKLFADKSLIMGGAIQKINDTIYTGDISAIILHHFPKIGRRFYTPDFETALMPKWDDKITRMAEITAKENVTLLAGVPSWTLVLLKRILAITKKNNISEVWPNLRSFLHGGVGFEPYRSEFKELIPSPNVIYRENYNASEGYFAIQNNTNFDGMLLLCDHEIFYEFIPFSDIDSPNPRCIPLDQTEPNEKYALVISTTSGLYRYRIGDVIQMVQCKPYKIKVVGREQEYINVFGEEVNVHNSDKALAMTCEHFGVSISQYSVGPVFLTNDQLGGHEWVVEFEKEPHDIAGFASLLDDNLKLINADYEAKRSFDLALSTLKMNAVPKGTFEKWLRNKNKYGGQNKVPRLKNDRIIIDQILLNATTLETSN
ncbi:MAG: GH3 auxin-responsive promoter family protein [Saprospiraceae bacterium]|nr:GH3 auxin-responsive promoter family protein [Bacteroidia bacterium]NNE16011.1 GH3 auxin-responsive promoter family protein [Saprospiraceae bacterium]NNL90711.1 GH3 auxin-responsive promoter family protein [Saprospiraceae bacterium]